MGRHPTAIVEDGAVLGSDVEIGPYCVVETGARIGSNVRLHSHVVIRGNTEIGSGTVVHAHTVLGGEGQIRNVSAPEAKLVIGAHNVFREGVTISAGSRKGGGLTQIGDGNYFMAYSHVGHDCRIGNGVTLSNGVQIGGHVEIADGVILGGLAAVQQFSRIGQYAFISGLSGVSADVIPYGMAVGLHVRLGGLNLVGLRRRGIARSNIHSLRAAFRAIFLEQEGTLHERARHAAETWPDVPEVQHVTDFILSDSKRPIAPARVRAEGQDEAP
ncbi:MAG: acyl-ACP--UDP-N-acetylglucosamine O-acyltransferase [Alphaproteobacteria bacterium]|nr:acyl-ACP--UDP-N-acetylglucosamine O-acyltransferase [Alphaproteobacteria bacterium]MBV9063206.1 acyl-ACP--UDP-N-acetylglucosamine O-acyltransferase [Alphaproteobacteria bacterium]